jgi:hypothetical protein
MIKVSLVKVENTISKNLVFFICCILSIHHHPLLGIPDNAHSPVCETLTGWQAGSPYTHS